MKKVDFLVIGGSAAGTTAADIIRGLSPNASITIVTDEDNEHYSRVLIPHYVRHKISREQVFLKKPEWYKDKLIELIKKTLVIRLNSETKTVTFSNGEEIQYGKLLIATGGKVIPFDVPGADSKNLLYMRTIVDADKIIETAKRSRKALIIGGGFIGLEMASSFAKNGVGDITVLVLEDFYWQGKLDVESSKVLTGVLVKNGIKIETNVSVDRFETNNGMIIAAIAKDGRRFEADMVGVGVGIKSDLAFLEGSGVNFEKGVLANEFLETNVVDIYAAGDCAEFKDVVFERQHILGNWANATSQGVAVGKTMVHSLTSGQAGVRTVFETASSYSISFFDPPNNGSCSFLGVTDVDFADMVIVRGSAQAGKVTCIFVKKIGEVDRVVGATVINNLADVAPLTMAIKNKVDIDVHLVHLDRADFDLKTLIAS